MEFRSQAAIEKRRQRDRDRHRKRWADPEYRRKKLARQKAHRQENKEHFRAYTKKKYFENKVEQNARRKKWAQDNRERTRKYQKEWYARNKEQCRTKQYATRKRREPWRGLFKLEWDYKAGRITYDQFAIGYGEALIRLDDRASRKSTAK